MAPRSRGQAAPLLCLLVVVVGGLVLGLGRLGQQAVARAAAQTAADAAALAGAAEGEDSARAVARENGGRLVSFRQLGSLAEVTVVVGGARATARAERLPSGAWSRTKWSETER